MFTIKYRSYSPSDVQQGGGFPCYDQNEQLHGPFDLISQEMVQGRLVVYAHRGAEPGMSFGPWVGAEIPAPSDTPQSAAPRPTLWVMNESGATVAKYDL